MNDPLIRTLLVSVVFAVIFGPLTARSTMRREPIYGGTMAQVLNLLACMTMVGLVPGILAAILFGAGALKAFLLGVTLMALTFAFTLMFAIAEKPAREQVLSSKRVDAGWTEKDAKTSGL